MASIPTDTPSANTPSDFASWLYLQGLDPTTMSDADLSSYYPQYQQSQQKGGDVAPTDPNATTTPPPPTVTTPPDVNEGGAPPPPAPAPAPTTSGPVAGPASAPTGSVGDLTAPFTGTFTPPPPVDLGGPAGVPYIPPTPTYTPPTLGKPPAFSYQDYTPGTFQAPTVEQALQDPGYQFRLQQGEQALQNWAAARGTLNDSGTAKNLIDYGQNAATQGYGDVWNRMYNAFQTNEGNRLGAYAQNRANAVSAYNTNYGTQYVDPYQANYKAFADTILNPGQTAYSTLAAAGQRQNEQNYANSYNRFLQGYDIFRNQQNDTFDKLFRTATA